MTHDTTYRCPACACSDHPVFRVTFRLNEVWTNPGGERWRVIAFTAKGVAKLVRISRGPADTMFLERPPLEWHAV